MTSDSAIWESGALRDLRHGAEARGLKFYLDPPPDVVPGFLGDFRPHALAVGEDGGIVIEVMRRGSPGTEKQLAEVARKVAAEKGWDFRAVFLNPPVDHMPIIENPAPKQLKSAFEEIRALTRSGHSGAALVLAFAALEALARLAATNGEAPAATNVSPVAAIQTLAEQGYLENEGADQLRGLVKLRNAVVHGDLSVDVAPTTVEEMLAQLRAIAAEIATVTKSG